MADEQLRPVAEFVDKISGPMKQIQKEMRAFHKDEQGRGRERRDETTKQSRSIKDLRDEWVKRLLGQGALGLAGTRVLSHAY
jgi:hypothetical protein